MSIRFLAVTAVLGFGVLACGPIPEKLATTESSRSGKSLILNGAAERQPFVLAPVTYELRLFLTQQSSNYRAILSSPEPKKLTLQARAEVKGKELQKRLMARFILVFGDLGTSLKPEFEAMLQVIPDLVPNDVLKWSAEDGLVDIWFERGSTRTLLLECPNQRAFHALLQLYIGANPIDADMKARLLGEQR